MRTLLHITEDLIALDELLEEVEGDISDPRVDAAVTAWMGELDTELQRKADNYVAFVKELEYRAKIREEEAHRLFHRAKTDVNSAAWLKGRLLAALQQRGLDRIDTERYRIAVCKSGGLPPLDIHSPQTIPTDYMRTIPARMEPDLAAIRAAIKAGREVPGVVVMERGHHLRIS